MVFVKVREVYDLHTITNKMSLIGIHTPKAGIIKRNFPGLLMQCKTYRPVSCDVRIACASMLPADPLQVGTTDGDIAPEDLFNPILYKAMSNLGMSQLESRVNSMGTGAVNLTTDGDNASVKGDGLLGSTLEDEFNLYYGLLADAHGWKHANPQAGLEMNGLKPLVYEMLYSIGDNSNGTISSSSSKAGHFTYPNENGTGSDAPSKVFKGHGKPMPMINCTSYNGGNVYPGFSDDSNLVNAEGIIPAPQIYVGCIIIPPSRLHQLYYRMVVEWTLEFSQIRSIHEITSWNGLSQLGSETHYIDYDYSSASKVAGVEKSNLTSDTTMVSANVEVNQVM